MPERIDAGPLLAAVGGAALMLSLFLNWFVAPAAPPTTTVETNIGSAWSAFETLDIVLAVLAGVSLYAAYEGIAGRDSLIGPMLLPLGLLALLIVVVQIVDPPPVINPPVEAAGFNAPDPGVGAWVALGGSAVLVIGGILSRARISITVLMDSSGRGGKRAERTA